MSNLTMSRKAALVACSDPLSEQRRQSIDNLTRILEINGITVVRSPYLFGCNEQDPGKAKAEVLNRAFTDPEMEFVFDVSGGDLANTVLRHLDYSAIQVSTACFYGFSDLTTVINAIAAKTGREAINYQARNIATSLEHIDTESLENNERIHYFVHSILQHKISANDLKPQFLRGNTMRGRVTGGNMRCMLKLAGTQYWPNLKGAVLLLEALGGGVSQMTTMVEQYLELGAAEKISGILLGTFTQMENEGLRPTIQEIILKSFPENIPVAQTMFVGHGSDARAIAIGREIQIGSAPQG